MVVIPYSFSCHRKTIHYIRIVQIKSIIIRVISNVLCYSPKTRSYFLNILIHDTTLHLFNSIKLRCLKYDEFFIANAFVSHCSFKLFLVISTKAFFDILINSTVSKRMIILIIVTSCIRYSL